MSEGVKASMSEGGIVCSRYVGNAGMGERARSELHQRRMLHGHGLAQARRARDRHSHSRSEAEGTAFGYDSDESSLSSNTSTSAQINGEAGGRGVVMSAATPLGPSGKACGAEGGGGGGSAVHASREWRSRAARLPRPRALPDRHLYNAYPFQVTFTPDNLLNGSKFDALSQEIWERFVSLQQTEDTFRKKMSLWRFLYLSIKTIFPRYGLYLVGSTMSGFGLDSSDMDLCLVVRSMDCPDPRSQALLHLTFMLDYIRSFDPGAELIHAKVPILKFRDVRHNLQVDLNCNNDVGIRNTNLLYCYSQMDWRVRALVVVAKVWAGAHDINDARRRTLSSYSLTLMVIHYLQCGVSPAVVGCVCVRGAWEGGVPAVRSPPSLNTLSLGELFLGFLNYYAHFPYDKMAVSVRLGRCVPVTECRAAKAYKNDPHQWKLLCVEEPFDLTNTARSVYDPETFEKIVNTFKCSYKRLAARLRLEEALRAQGAHEHAPPAHDDLPR